MPQINDPGDIVWAAASPTGNEVMLYTSSTGLITPISDDNYSGSPPQINNHGNVVWFQPDSTYSGTASPAEIFVYESSTDSITQVSRNDYIDYRLVIGNRGDVAWLQAAQSSDTSEIFIARPVTEPATMLLLGTGLFGLAVFSRRRFRKWNCNSVVEEKRQGQQWFCLILHLSLLLVCFYIYLQAAFYFLFYD